MKLLYRVYPWVLPPLLIYLTLAFVIGSFDVLWPESEFEGMASRMTMVICSPLITVALLVHRGIMKEERKK